MYVFKDWSMNEEAYANLESTYKIAASVDDGGMYDPIVLTASSFVIPLPASATTSAPALLGDIVPFYTSNTEK